MGEKPLSARIELPARPAVAAPGSPSPAGSGRPASGGSQLALGQLSYHAFITDRDGDTLDLEADHRRHAEIENAIRDRVKYGAGAVAMVASPSGRP